MLLCFVSSIETASENNFITLEYHCNRGENLKKEMGSLRGHGNAKVEEMILDDWPNVDAIKSSYKKKFIFITGFVLLQCYAVSIGSHFLFCGKSFSVGPLFNLFSSF